jgi:hypothetical protein
MNADENKMLIGVYLRLSAAIDDFFTASDGRGSDGIVNTTGLLSGAATGVPHRVGSGLTKKRADR